MRRPSRNNNPTRPGQLSPARIFAPLTLGAAVALAFQSGAWAQQAPDQSAVPKPNVPGAPAGGTPGFPATGNLGQAPAAAPEDAIDLSKPPPFYIQAVISSELTWTNNATFGSGTGKQRDELLDITPSLIVHGEGAHYRVDGNFAFDGIASAEHTQPDRILPRGNLLFNADLVENLLYLDAGIRSARFVDNPFGVASVGPATSFNEYTTTQYRVAPYILRELTPDLTFSARSDNSYSSTNAPGGFDSTSGYYGMQTVRLDRHPQPLGWGLEISQSDTRFKDQPDDALKDDAGRASINYSFDPVLVGLIGGYEHAYLSGASTTHAIVGFRGEWRPDVRTSFIGTVEERYFGTGWNLKGLHREEDFVVSANWVRDVTTYPTLLSSQVGTGFVPSLLDSLLSSEYQNATARTAAAQNLILTTGLPTDLAGASQVASAQALLVDTASASAIFLGKFNTLSLTVYRTRTVPYYLPGEALSVSTVPTAYIDNVATGGTINLDHRLSPTWDVNATLLRANTDGLGIVSGASSKQTSIIIQLNDRLSMRTNAFLGVRHQILDSTLVSSATESAVFVGITHRF